METTEIRGHYQSWENSGKALAEYCRAAGIKSQALYDFRYKRLKKQRESAVLCNQKQAAQKEEKIRFTEIQTSMHGVPTYTVTFLDGTVIELPLQAISREIQGFIVGLHSQIQRKGVIC